MTNTLKQLQGRLISEFYARDFEDGRNAKTFWTREFKEARQLETLDELKKWAEWMLDYTSDFSCDYIKEEIEQLLTDIMEA